MHLDNEAQVYVLSRNSTELVEVKEYIFTVQVEYHVKAHSQDEAWEKVGKIRMPYDDEEQNLSEDVEYVGRSDINFEERIDSSRTS